MTTDVAVSAPESPVTAPPVFEPAVSETKTDAEREYFQSRGTKGDGLYKKPEAAPVTKTEGGPAPTKQEPTEAFEDGEIIVEADGTRREKSTGRFVPKSAFLRIKDELKTVRQERDSSRDTAIAARERLSVLLEAMPKEAAPANAKPDADTEPDPEKDVFGWIAWARKQLNANKEAATKTQADIQADRERASLQTFFKSDVDTFQKANPDFIEALNFGIGVRHKMMEAVGVKDPAARQTAVLREINDLIKSSKADGSSVAAKLYEAAKTLGYSKKEAPAANGKTDAAIAELARLSNAQAATATLGSSGTGGVGENLTRERLASMGDGDFSTARTAYIAKHGRQAWNDFLGGKR